MSNRKKTVHSQGREIIYSVYKFMTEEKGAPVIPLSNVQERVARATGVGLNTVKRVIAEAKRKPEGSKFTSPRKRTKKSSPKSTVDQFQEEIIRNTIYTYASIHKQRPTMKAIFELLKTEEGVNFTGKLSSFRNLIRKMGFRWKKTQDNRKVLIEKTDIRAKRVEFLRKLQQYKKENRNIVYCDETYLHSSHTVPKSWDDGNNKCLNAPVAKGQRLIILHAGGKKGFIPNGLLIFKSGLKTGDYHDDMNHKNFTKWLEEKFLPNVEKNSVLVVDNASYHNVTTEPNPTTAWKKEDMRRWLAERGISYEVKHTKTELYSKIQANKPAHKTYAIDALLARHGHVVLRLPPYHPELNPIEKIWALVKNYVAAHNTTFKLDDVRKLAEDKFSSVTVQEWENVCSSAEKVEKEYLEKEYIMDDIEDLIIRVGEDSDDSDFYVTSDEDGGSDDNLGCAPLR